MTRQFITVDLNNQTPREQMPMNSIGMEYTHITIGHCTRRYLFVETHLLTLGGYLFLGIHHDHCSLRP